jgi:predicted transcriptional regulator
VPSTPLSAQLRAARVDAGLSVSEVARRAHTSRAAIYAYESGAISPSLDTAQRVLAASGSELVVLPTTPTTAP